MNKWFYRAVGTVGVAGGFLLLGGAAHADETDAARPAIDPQQLRGLFDELLTPMVGGTPAGLLADMPAAQPVRSGDAADAPALARGATGAPGTVSTAGNDVFLTGPLPDVGDQLALDRLAPTQNLGMLPAAPRTPAAGVRPVADTSESTATGLLPVPNLSSLPVSNLPVSNLPLVGQTLNSQTITPTQGDSPLRAAQAPVGARTLPATAGVPGTSDLPAALPVAGVDPVGPAGLVDTLPGLGGAGDGGTVDGDQLGLVPSGVRPSVKTGSVGTRVPGMGKVGLDDRGAAPATSNRAAAPTADDRAAAPGVPALIGDALTAQRPDLFGPAAATTATAPGGRIADRPIGRHAERPIAGEDADFS